MPKRCRQLLPCLHAIFHSGRDRASIWMMMALEKRGDKSALVGAMSHQRTSRRRLQSPIVSSDFTIYSNWHFLNGYHGDGQVSCLTRIRDATVRTLARGSRMIRWEQTVERRTVKRERGSRSRKQQLPSFIFCLSSFLSSNFFFPSQVFTFTLHDAAFTSLTTPLHRWFRGTWPRSVILIIVV